VGKAKKSGCPPPCYMLGGGDGGVRRWWGDCRRGPLRKDKRNGWGTANITTPKKSWHLGFLPSVGGKQKERARAGGSQRGGSINWGRLESLRGNRGRCRLDASNGFQCGSPTESAPQIRRFFGSHGAEGFPSDLPELGPLVLREERAMKHHASRRPCDMPCAQMERTAAPCQHKGGGVAMMSLMWS